MRVHIVGDGLLAETTRQACAPHFELTAVQPDIQWVCSEPFTEFEPTAPLIVVSSPVLIGTCAGVQARWPARKVVYSPENIRYATALEDFHKQQRIVVGGHPDPRPIRELFEPFCRNIIWTDLETAEMVKHALNTFLALCVTFGNELGELCEKYGADNATVVAALHTERRVGRHAPIRAGAPPSDHLLREVDNMVRLGAGPLIRSLT